LRQGFAARNRSFVGNPEVPGLERIEIDLKTNDLGNGLRTSPASPSLPWPLVGNGGHFDEDAAITQSVDACELGVNFLTLRRPTVFRVILYILGKALRDELTSSANSGLPPKRTAPDSFGTGRATRAPSGFCRG